ncbi:MAG: hypothetical protein IJO75_01700 [Clostridia bacterium]|nr:hypothetical protein [Clostridia bacterium]
MSDIRRPNITATTAEGQLDQIKVYLHQLVDQLNFAITKAGSGSNSAANDNAAQITENMINEVYKIVGNKFVSQYVKNADFSNFKISIGDRVTKLEDGAVSVQEIRQGGSYIKIGISDEEHGVEIGIEGKDGDIPLARFTGADLMLGGTPLADFQCDVGVTDTGWRYRKSYKSGLAELWYSAKLSEEENTGVLSLQLAYPSELKLTEIISVAGTLNSALNGNISIEKNDTVSCTVRVHSSTGKFAENTTAEVAVYILAKWK